MPGLNTNNYDRVKYTSPWTRYHRPQMTLPLLGSGGGTGGPPFNPVTYYGASLLFHADAVTNPTTTFYTSSALTTPSVNPADPIQAIASSVGGLSATKTTTEWFLRTNRVGSAPSAWGGADVSTPTAGFLITGINITLASEMTFCVLLQSPGLYPQGTSNPLFSPTSINTTYELEQSFGVDFITQAGGTNPVLFSGDGGSGSSADHMGNVGLWEAQVWTMHGTTTTLYRLSARGIETSSVVANFPASACANATILGLGTLNYNGEVSRVSIINRAVTAAEAIQQLSWLVSSSIIAAPTTRSIFIPEGSSITAGNTTAIDTHFTGVLAKAFTPQAIQIGNYGISGRMTQTIKQFSQPYTLGLFAGRSNTGDIYSVGECAGNDITFNATSGNYTTYDATSFANVVAAAQNARSLMPSTGNILLETIPPRTALTGSLSNAQWETCRTAHNNRLVAAFPTAVPGVPYLYTGTTYPNIYLIDSGRITGIATPTDTTGANFTDLVHYAAPGEAIKAAVYQAVIIYLGGYTVLNPPTCPGLQTWWTWQRGVTSDVVGAVQKGCVEAAVGDTNLFWSSLLPTVGGQVLQKNGSVSTPTLQTLNGRSVLQTVSGTPAYLRNLGACTVPFPCTIWIAGTITATLADQAFLFGTDSQTTPGVSGLICKVSGSPRLGSSWNLGAPTYGYVGGPVLPSIGTRCLLAAVFQSTGITHYVQTSGGQTSATNTTALSALSPNTSTMGMGVCYGGFGNASYAYEQIGIVNGALGSTDITNLWNSLP